MPPTLLVTGAFDTVDVTFGAPAALLNNAGIGGGFARGGRSGARLAPAVPMQRAGTPEEIAGAVLRLLSPEASYVNGAILDVSGAR